MMTRIREKGWIGPPGKNGIGWERGRRERWQGRREWSEREVEARWQGKREWLEREEVGEWGEVAG